MAFWVDWQLWEKLSAVLGVLITLVLIYGFCALAYHRWMIRRYTIAELRQKEGQTEIYPMLARDDVPFGARAIEQGIEVEGIWICSQNAPTPSPLASPQFPGTPTDSQPESPVPRSFARRPASSTLSMALDGATPSQTSLPSYTRAVMQPEIDIVAANHYTYEPPGPGGVYNPVMSMSSGESPSTFKRRSDTFNTEKRASFHSRIWRTSRAFDSRNTRSGSHSHDDLALAAAESQQTPRIHRMLRRRSSEEFRRKMSQIFNDRIHMNVPAEQLQFNPAIREAQRRKLRQALLGPFRP